MTDNDDTTESIESISALRDRRAALGGEDNPLADALDRKIADAEEELAEYEQLTELKIKLAEAEEAGLEDDPAIQGLRERIDDLEQVLGLSGPEDDGEEQVAALKAARRGARQTGNDQLAERYDRKIDDAETEQEIRESGDEQISALSECDTPAERAQARIQHARGQMGEEARDQLATARTGLELMTAMRDNDQYDTDLCEGARRHTQEQIASLCEEEAGVEVPELKRGA